MAAKLVFHSLSRVCSLVRPNQYGVIRYHLLPLQRVDVFVSTFRPISPNPAWGLRKLSHGSVSLVLSREGKAKFEINEVEPPKKHKWLSKKRFNMKKRREKLKRKEANRNDPRRLGLKIKKKGLLNAEERLLFKIRKAKHKEASLIKILTRYEIPKAQGPVVKPVNLTGEERFFIKKMAQKKSNYAPVGRRGIFGGVILNMHMHWKKHETVKVICKSCKPGQIYEYAQDIARLSGGIPIQFIGKDTIVFYRGRNYVQPKVMSPVDTLSRKKAYEKSKYEQSLDSVRQFIAITEKELELYRRHISLYGDPNNKNHVSVVDVSRKANAESKRPKESEKDEKIDCTSDLSSFRLTDVEADSEKLELSESDGSDNFENNSLSTSESDSECDSHFDCDSDFEESSSTESCTMVAQSSASLKQCDFDNQRFH